MSDWYTPSSVPGFKAALSSATIRSEYVLIQAAMAKLPTLTGNGDEIVKVNAGATALETLAQITVPLGGTGAGTLTDGGVLLGSGTGAVTATAQGADGEVLVGTGAGDPVWESGATLRTSIGLGTGDSPTFAALTLTAALTVPNGGTGVATLADGGVLLGSGTGAVSVTAQGADGEVLVGTGAGDPVWESGATLRTSIGLGTGNSPTFAGLTLSSPLSVANGGSGAATLTDGGILLGSGTGAITAMAALAKGSIVAGDGTTDPVELTVGTNDYVLTADSAEASGLKWAAVGGGGGIGTLSTIKAATVQVGDADIATLDFASEFTLSESPNTEINISIKASSETVAGIVELATITEANTGSDATRAISPATLAGWAGNSNIATVGTITSGNWQAGVISVASGGSGLSTMADGGVLLGSGTSPVTVMARLTNGEIIVGQSSGDPIAMSGATARSALGVVNNETHTGDVTGSTSLTIANSAVSNAKMADMTASTIKGRISTTGAPQDLTATQVRTIINVENGATADQSAGEILTLLSGVDGSGSGLDADLLDGVQGSAYLRDTTDTFTGTLTVSGAITVSGDVTANTSDGRLKREWVRLENVLDRMELMAVGRYAWTEQAVALNPQLTLDERRLGLIAQEVQKYWPEAVAQAPFDRDPVTGESISGENYLTIRYEHLVPVLWQAVIDLRNELYDLKDLSPA